MGNPSVIFIKFLPVNLVFQLIRISNKMQGIRYLQLNNCICCLLLWSFPNLTSISDTRKHLSYTITDTMKSNLNFIAFISKHHTVLKWECVCSGAMFLNLILQYEMYSTFIKTATCGNCSLHTQANMQKLKCTPLKY